MKHCASGWSSVSSRVPQGSSPSTLRLRLHTNMSRRARWWARLGLLPQCGPLPSTIESTLSDGGLVGEMKVMVARLYPLYYERSQDSVGLFRGEKAHLKRLRETEKQRELLVDQGAGISCQTFQIASSSFEMVEVSSRRIRAFITPQRFSIVDISGLCPGQSSMKST
ncbi:Breast cancer type 2 susceptibility [Chionoecetes opilio]|uniref:Breast cancer type 2 susceptibility n=1 Tax=Chionoecetes opilio TaxID=41210 RepID=A0A8J5CRR9_CHIOP|nr:Breast cancer type 2 susceptibility [Chionoecetes opilio]